MAIDFENETLKPFLKKSSCAKNDIHPNAHERLSRILNKKEIVIENKEKFITEWKEKYKNLEER